MSVAKLNKEFTQEEARELYTMLYTLVFALRDIVKRGLTVESIKEFSKELAVYFSSVQRVLTQAEQLLKKIDDPEPPIVQDIEDKLLGKKDKESDEEGKEE